MDYSKLEKRRGELRLTQGELAERAGIKLGTYHRVLKENNTTIKTLEKISEALEVNSSYWWEDSEEVNANNTGSENESNLRDIIAYQKEAISNQKDIIRELRRQIESLQNEPGRKINKPA